MNSEAPEQWEQRAWRSGLRLPFRLMPEAEFVLALDNRVLDLLAASQRICQVKLDSA